MLSRAFQPPVSALPPLPARRIATTADAHALFAPLITAPREMVAFAYLEPEWMLLGLRHSDQGEIDRVDLIPQDVVRDAIAFNAAAVVMAHNHPSGDPTPSIADRNATARLGRALDTIDVKLIEHLIIASGGTTSFRETGWL